MKNRKIVLSTLVCVIAIGLILVTCASIDYGQPTTYPDNEGNLLSKWEAFGEHEGQVVLEEVYSFFDNGEYYMFNHHNLKNDVAETGTWTGSLEPGGEIKMTVDWYRGVGSPPSVTGKSDFFHEIGYKKYPPPIEYTAEISMDGQMLTAERWDYAIRNAHADDGWIHSGATHKDYALQQPKAQ